MKLPCWPSRPLSPRDPQRKIAVVVRRNVVALLALLAIAPGVPTLVDLSAHALTVDATIESAARHHDEHEDSERGCSGPFHVCACHTPSLVGVFRRGVEVRVDPPAMSAAAPPESFARGRAGFRSSIFRPPIA